VKWRLVVGRTRAPGAAYVFVVVFVVALANRLLPVLRGAGLSGVLGYDDGVYYAGAVGLVHGRLPYRDFLFLHPPGVLLALAPVAATGRWLGETSGWEGSRLVWMLMGCVTSLILVGALLPMGRLAAAVAGCVYSVFPGAVLVERTTLLEGLTNVCLAAALALLIREFASTPPDVGAARGRTLLAPAAAGAILGFATAVKIWGVVPLTVVCVFAVIAIEARRGLAVALSAAIAITVVCLPFFLAGPAEMWRMVVLDQIGRDQGADLMLRAAQIVTMGRITGGSVSFVVVIVALAGLAGCCVVAWRAKPFRVVVPLLASMIGLLMASPIFFPHYLGALAVPTAMLAGAVTGVLTAAPERLPWRLGVAIVGCIALAIDAVALFRIQSGESVPVELAGAVQPAPGCMTSDDSNNLLALGVVGRNVIRGCDLVVDLGGYSHEIASDDHVPRPQHRLAALSAAIPREWPLHSRDTVQPGPRLHRVDGGTDRKLAAAAARRGLRAAPTPGLNPAALSAWGLSA
jgi:alpha-1,2-mannosyltransferase